MAGARRRQSRGATQPAEGAPDGSGRGARHGRRSGGHPVAADEEHDVAEAGDALGGDGGTAPRAPLREDKELG